MLGKIVGGGGRNHQNSKSFFLGGFLLLLFVFLLCFQHLTLSLWLVHNCFSQPFHQTSQGLLLFSYLLSLVVVLVVGISQRIV